MNDNDKVEAKFLGILWNKCDDIYDDEIEVKELEAVTKRLMFKTLASIYDPLRIISLMLLEGKLCIDKQLMREKVGTSKLVKSLGENRINGTGVCRQLRYQDRLHPILKM